MQFTGDLLHRPALNMKGPPDARNRIHSLQLPLHPPSKNGWSDKSEGGQNWTPITPLMGSILHAETQLLLLTGARLNEILTLKWEWVDLEHDCIRLPDSKTGAKTIYLSAPAKQVFAGIPRLQNNPHVICGKIGGSALVNLQKPWSLLRVRAGFGDVRIHDLRHSFASIAVASGMSLPLIGKLLGHSQPQTTQRYAHLADDPMRQAAGIVGAKMDILPRLRTVS
jgi:integrase